MISIADSKYAKERLEDRHANALIEYMGKDKTKEIDSIVKNFFSNVGINSFYDLICASPSKLVQVVTEFEKLDTLTKLKIKGLEQLKDCYDKILTKLKSESIYANENILSSIMKLEREKTLCRERKDISSLLGNLLSLLDSSKQLSCKKIYGEFYEKIKTEVEAIEELLNNASGCQIKGLLNFVSLYDKFVKEDGLTEHYSSDKLIEDCDILTCPYCNENYTYRIVCSNDKKTTRRTFDWDHLFPKQKYPFLAVSFYNLVPSCKVCNTFKNADSKLFFNPFQNVNIDDVYRFNFSLDTKLNTILEDKGTSENQNTLPWKIIEFKTQDLVLNNSLKELFESVKLKERMEQHKGVINLVVERAKMYNEIVLNGYDKQLSSLGLNGFTEEMKAVYWGIELDHRKYYLKPFSKLTNDLIKEIL